MQTGWGCCCCSHGGVCSGCLCRTWASSTRRQTSGRCKPQGATSTQQWTGCCKTCDVGAAVVMISCCMELICSFLCPGSRASPPLYRAPNASSGLPLHRLRASEEHQGQQSPSPPILTSFRVFTTKPRLVPYRSNKPKQIVVSRSWASQASLLLKSCLELACCCC